MGRSKPLNANADEPLNTELELRHCPFCGAIPKAVEYGIPRSGATAFRAEVFCDQCEVSPSIYSDGDDGFGHHPDRTEAARLAVVVGWNRRVI